MNDLDLNIDNYELRDLIKLFNMPLHFQESDLKDAKKIVLKTHPDKSGLDKEYFLFFSQAFKYLLKVYQLRQSSSITNTEYDNSDLDCSFKSEHTILIDGEIKNMDQNQYIDWFNKAFDKMKVNDDNNDDGYGDWLKTDEGLVNKQANNSREMNELINEKKNHIRSLVLHNDFTDSNNSNHFDLIRDRPENYGSSMFDKLQFEDVRKAHMESVIPVTDEDFHNRKKYTNIDELNRERTTDLKISSKQWYTAHENKLNKLKTDDEDLNIQRAYKLMNQDEVIRRNYDKFWSELKQIKN
jgi:hypothetical protein